MCVIFMMRTYIQYLSANSPIVFLPCLSKLKHGIEPMVAQQSPVYDCMVLMGAYACMIHVLVNQCKIVSRIVGRAAEETFFQLWEIHVYTYTSG